MKYNTHNAKKAASSSQQLTEKNACKKHGQPPFGVKKWQNLGFLLPSIIQNLIFCLKASGRKGEKGGALPTIAV